ncbi:EndoU domain-containing protein, partial [Bacillus cereus group sp. Bce001]|uniref:EndoU domain-containing protein n=1 Tax=Bacillus cereus group sp. Bce001 TaxID=3445260 RepID=UPI003F259730
MPKNQFAYAGANNIRYKFDTSDFHRVEEKLSTHQFAKGEFGSSGNKSPDKIHQSDIEKKQWLESLQNTENFKQGTKENGINHIFNGFHYEGTPNSNSKIVGDLDPSNEFGVYQAKVEIDGVLKGPKSTFFPKDWTPQ